MTPIESLQYIVNRGNCDGLSCFLCYYKRCIDTLCNVLVKQAEIDLNMELSKLHDLIVEE